jgi:hypothetical protein
VADYFVLQTYQLVREEAGTFFHSHYHAPSDTVWVSTLDSVRCFKREVGDEFLGSFYCLSLVDSC